MNEGESTQETEAISAVEKNLQELARRREAGELAPEDFEVNYLCYLQESGQPLTREDVGERAVVLRPEELELLGYLDLVLANGEKITLDLSTLPPTTLIIFPEELGTLEEQNG